MSDSAPYEKPFDTTLMDLRRSNGDVLSLHRKIITSGEGTIYATEDSKVLAKIYHHPSLEKANKLQKMIASPPHDPIKSQGLTGHVSIAWPLDLILNKKGAVQGFLMPKVRGGMHLTHVYNPRLRRQKSPDFNWYYLHTTALNVAWILKALHEKKCVVGDLKPENFLVNAKALVTILDTDSFQIYEEETGTLFLSPVGSEGFTAPEAIGKNLTQEPRTELHDRFGLAILIYMLLFGVHPFSGIWKGEGEPPSLDTRIFEGLSFFSSPLFEEGLLAPPFSILPSFLQNAFKQAFLEGHKTPSARPSATVWINLLKKSLSLLEVCPSHLNHFYYPTQGPCPWCLHLLETNVDLFPSLAAKDKHNAFLIAKQFESFLKQGDVENAQKILGFLKENCDPALLKKYEESLKFTQTLVAHFKEFAKILQNSHEHMEKDFLTYWESFSFKDHPLVERPLPLFQGKSLRSIFEILQKRYTLLKELDALFKKTQSMGASPLLYFDDMLRLWDPDLFEGHKEALKLAPLIQKAQHAFKTYTLLKSALLNNLLQDALVLWEPFFKDRLLRDGLVDPLRHMFEEFSQSLPKDILLGTSLFYKKDGVLVCPKLSPLPHAIKSLTPHLTLGISLSFSKDFEAPFFISQKNIEALGGELFIPFLSEDQKSSPSRLFLRPVFFLSEFVFPFGDVFSPKERSAPVEVFMKTSLLKPSFLMKFGASQEHLPLLKISFFSKTSLLLPTLLIKSGISRIPLACEEAPNAFIIGEIPSCTLMANTIHEEEILLNPEFSEKFLDKLQFSLEPKNLPKDQTPFFFSSL